VPALLVTIELSLVGSRRSDRPSAMSPALVGLRTDPPTLRVPHSLAPQGRWTPSKPSRLIEAEGRSRREVASLGPVLILVGALLLGLMIAVFVFVVGMRAKTPWVLNAVRRFNRVFMNPRMMKKAGTPGAYASVIRHVGRTTGRPYETPVGAFATDDGFVISLPYGSDTDWVKNVLASGSATIVHEGDTYRVDHPELVPTTVAAPHLPPGEQRNLRRFAVDQCLRVVRVDRDEASEHRSRQGGRLQHMRLA
jgi:deazaflavin-dependent oxidoreductase (nitroreductase family)